ncbi:NYN domain [Corynebacterium renale]|uniref:NYN domain-containing protein n=1 Tax=Corynebacterium renale TaxID=1724 RepID=UPI000DA35AF1|nr:NYN domain-containing protein [Corynebacterium renale]SQG63532.1 NYN domain [Corynebacterium renale]STD00697.1 NYN domain [Corynebacterium renale]
MIERTIVYVDTSYLLASFYNSWETGARAQLEIDLPEVVSQLGRMIEEHLGQPIHRQYWYDGIPDSGPHRYQRALRTCNGVQLRAGQLIEWGERRTQKAVDTRLVADMVVAGVNQQFSDMVLVSGDADMIPGVNEACNHGARVHLYGFGWDSMSSALRHACDSTTILDPREDFADAMQLEVLEGPLPPVIPARPFGETEEPEEGGLTPIPEEKTQAAPAAGSTLSDASQPETPTTEENAATADSGAGDAADAGDCPPPRPGAGFPTTQGGTITPGGEQHNPQEAFASPAEVARGTQAVHNQATSMVDRQLEEERQAAQTGGDKLPAPQHDTAPAGPGDAEGQDADASTPEGPRPAPKPSMMAPKRKLRSRYVPLPNEVWASAGFQTPFDVGQQYAAWWYDNAASADQRDQAHLLSGGGLPPEVDRPLLQFACETLHEYTLSESQRVNLRDGFHAGIRSVLITVRRSEQ